MTRKHFEAIAAVLKSRQNDPDKTVRATAAGIARDMTVVLAETNPRFDRNRFLTACGAA